MLSKGVLSARLSTLFMANIIRLFCLGLTVIQTLLIFPFASNFSSGYLRWSTGRDYPVFISMTSYQTAARETNNLQPTCLWPLSCGSRFFLGDTILQLLVYQLIHSVSPVASWW